MKPRSLLTPAIAAVVGALLVAWAGLLTPAFSDYETEAEPAFDLLRAGHLHGFLAHAPAYGGSLVLRAPFVVAVTLWNGGGDAAFRASAVPAILASIVLALLVFRRASGAGAWLALGLIAFNPVTISSYDIGHPEELLVGAFCVGAVLAALADRPVWAGALVGAAVAGKPWAVLAVAPVVLALTGVRARVLALGAAGVVGALILAPLVLAGGQSLSGAAGAAHTTGGIFNPAQIWWFFGAHTAPLHGTVVVHHGYRAEPSWLTAPAHPLLIAVCLAVCGAWAAVRRDAPRTDVLGLLALVLLLRCVLDPWNVVYYELPFLLALTAWEAMLRRPPVAALAATVLTFATLDVATGRLTPDVQTAVYLAWALPLVAALGVRVMAPGRFAKLAAPVAGAMRRGLPSLAGLVAGKPAGAPSA